MTDGVEDGDGDGVGEGWEFWAKKPVRAVVSKKQMASTEDIFGPLETRIFLFWRFGIPLAVALEPIGEFAFALFEFVVVYQTAF